MGSLAPEGSVDAAGIVERFRLRAFVESCLVLEDGVSTMREIDAGMSGAAGLKPPLGDADAQGLDVVLEQLERAEARWGENFTAPAILRRLVSQGRLGRSSGQGFYPYAQPDDGWAESAVKLESREDVAIAWLDRPPANGISAETVKALERVWGAVEGAGVRALVFASTNPQLFCAGADIKAFTKMDGTSGRRLAEDVHGFLRRMETSRVVTIAAVNGLALGGGCELAMGCDVRLVAESASFGQPEIGLGLIPGFGGTQRLPRLVGEARALEMNLLGDPIGAYAALEAGLANRVMPDHELFDGALAWARRLARQAPVAVGQIKRLTLVGDLGAGLREEQSAFGAVFGSEDAREGIAAFMGKRSPRFHGR